MAEQADSVNFVVFGPTPSVNVSELFRRVFAAEITNLQTVPGRPAVASGSVGDLLVTLISVAGRVEIAVGPQPATIEPPTTIDVEQGLKRIVEAAPKLLAEFPCTRMGLIGNLFAIADTAESANENFLRLTSIKAPPDATDLSFSINRRKSVNGHDINRLLKWDAATRQLLHISSNQPPSNIFLYGVASVFDINTVPNSNPFDVSQAVEIFGSLVSEMRECISGGYEYLCR